MKSVYITAIVGAFAASSAVNAQCVCAPTDSACLSDCVGRTNSCIAECQSNNECYQSCIYMHWPGVEPNYSESSMMMMPTATWMQSSGYSATPTSSWSSMWSESSSWNSYATPTWSSMWPQSSGWPSGSAWSSGASWTHTGSLMPTNMNPAASGTVMPSRSSASTTQMSSVVIGLGLACAAYLLQ